MFSLMLKGRAALNVEKGLLVRAACFSVLISLPSLLHYFLYGEGSPHSFNDSDEPVYLVLPYLRATGRNIAALFYEHGQREPLGAIISSAPNAWIDVLVGKGALALALTSMQLGLALDLVCGFICYLLFTAVFRALQPSRLAAELAAILVLKSLFLVEALAAVQLSIPLPSWITSEAGFDLDKTPVTRALYTQLSYPLFALALLWGIGAVRDKSSTALKSAAGCSLLCACAFYVYVFAWCSVGFLCLGLIVAEGVRQALIDTDRLRALRQAATHAAIFLTVQFIAIMPAWFLSEHYASSPWPELKTVAFFSPERFALFLCFAWLALRVRREPKLFTQAALLALCFLGELCLANIQFIIGRPICPYHFGGLYLYRLAGGLSVCFLLSVTPQRRVPRTIALGLICIIAASTFGSIAGKTIAAPELGDREFASVLRFLKGVPPNSVLAVLDSPVEDRGRVPETLFLDRLFPVTYSVLSGRPVLHQVWTGDPAISRLEILKREKAQGFYYYGEPSYLWACPIPTPSLPGDLYALTSVYGLLSRFKDCKQYFEALADYSACDVIRDFRLDYVIWDKSSPPEKPAWYTRAMRKVFESDERRYEVYQFDRDRAKRLFGCEHTSAIGAGDKRLPPLVPVVALRR